MKLYLVRHGETDFNRRGVVQGGGVDSELNETGRQQAALLYEAYKSIPFDSIFVSPLKRTHQTVAKWLEEEHNSFAGTTPRHFIEPGLTELSWGILEGKVPTPEQYEDFLQMKAKWQLGQLDLSVEGGESPNQCLSRVKKVFDRLIADHLHETILVCSHGRTSRVILAFLFGGGLHAMEEFNHANTGMNIINYNTQSGWILKAQNDCSHLTTIDSA